MLLQILIGPPSLAQISVLLLTEFFSLCMLLQILIGPPLNIFYATLKVQHLMVSISLEIPPLLYMVLQMQIRSLVLMIANLRMVTLSSLVRR